MCNLSKGVEQKGIEKGRQEGRQESMIEIAKHLLKQGALSIEQIAQCVWLDVEKVIELSENM